VQLVAALKGRKVTAETQGMQVFQEVMDQPDKSGTVVILPLMEPMEQKDRKAFQASQDKMASQAPKGRRETLDSQALVSKAIKDR